VSESQRTTTFVTASCTWTAASAVFVEARAAVVYDVGGTGTVLVKTTAGRYFLEARTVLDRAARVPVTAVNHDGRLSHDRTHILNLSGAKRWAVGYHSVAFGGWLAFRSGAAASAGGCILGVRF
jgi:hypothetical protein